MQEEQKQMIDFYDYLADVANDPVKPRNVKIVRGFHLISDLSPNLFYLEIDESVVISMMGNPWMVGFNEAEHYLRWIDTWKGFPECDIFDHLDELELTERIYVVAPGPNGAAYWDQIGDDSFVIIVNKACEISLKRRDIWLVSDPHIDNLIQNNLPWFNEGIESCASIGCFDYGSLSTNFIVNREDFSDNPVMTRLCERYSNGPAMRVTMQDLLPEIKYSHQWGPEMEEGSVAPIPRLLRGGANISGRAAQLAYQLGAKEIILCGVDLTGLTYYDGKDTGMPGRRGDTWDKEVAIFQELCEWLKGEGIRVASLSETALDVEIETVQSRELWRP